MCMNAFFLCLCIICLSVIHESQKWVLESLGVELQILGAVVWVLRITPVSSIKGGNTLNY